MTGSISVPDGFPLCYRRADVDVKRHTAVRDYRGRVLGYQWVKVWIGETNRFGDFDARDWDESGKYRADAPGRVFEMDGVSHTCAPAVSQVVRIH